MCLENTSLSTKVKILEYMGENSVEIKKSTNQR